MPPLPGVHLPNVSGVCCSSDRFFYCSNVLWFPSVYWSYYRDRVVILPSTPSSPHPFTSPYTAELHLSGSWLSASPIIRIGLALCVNVPSSSVVNRQLLMPSSSVSSRQLLIPSSSVSSRQLAMSSSSVSNRQLLMPSSSVPSRQLLMPNSSVVSRQLLMSSSVASRQLLMLSSCDIQDKSSALLMPSFSVANSQLLMLGSSVIQCQSCPVISLRTIPQMVSPIYIPPGIASDPCCHL